MCVVEEHALAERDFIAFVGQARGHVIEHR